MTLQRLLNTIGIIGVRDKMVNFTGCGGSVYELNDLTIKNYPILYVSPTGTHRVEENYTTYQLTIFYIDRLLEDNSNAVDIHSAAVEVLKNIIRTIENKDGVIGVSDEYSINLFTETEKFKDRCNGAYATVEISVVNDTVCEAEYDDYNGEPGTSKYIQFTSPVEFDTVIAHDVPFFVFTWKTSEPSTHYVIYRAIGAEYSIIMEGDTEQTVIPFSDLGNSGNTEITYEVQISNEAGTESRMLRQLPYYFLNFTNQDNVQLSADTNDYLISWNTNLETVGWKLYRNGKLYSSGQTTNTSIMAQFPVNTSDESVSYRFVAGYPGGGFERTLNWTQAAAVSYYFNVTNPDLMVMQPSESSYTVNFETNCEGDITFKILQCSMCDWVGEYVWKYGTPKQIVVPRPSYRTDDHSEWLVYHPHYNGSEIPTYFGIEVQKFYFDISTEDNQKIDSTATSFTINYQTNYSEVSYTFGDVTGTTSGGTLTVTFPENTGASAVAMEILFQDSDGNVVGTVHWSQNQYNTYFNILTASGQTISPAATAFTIEYETNMTPPYAYSYTDSEGVTIWRNAWSPSSLTINFSPNDSQSVRERTVRLALRDINWYQEVPYLNFTSYPSEISGERQLVCFGWECNTGGKVKYELYSGDTQYGEMDYVRSGRTDSMSGDCITFSANTGDDRYYQLDIAASFAGSDTYYVVFDSITFKQEGDNDSGVTPDTGSTDYFPDTRSGYSKEYLTLEIISGGTLHFEQLSDEPRHKQYSRDSGHTWVDITNGDSIEVNSGERINLRDGGGYPDSVHNYYNWSMVINGTAYFNAEGNILSFAKYTSNLFQNSNVVSARNLVIENGEWCNYMFDGCSKLVIAPALPSLNVKINGYERMFRNCTSLVNAPELPATALGNYCYEFMFAGCTSLVNAPELPATTLAKGCYAWMFDGCTSLVNAPELPSLNISSYSYAWMFRNCTSLVNAPELPATAISDHCYEFMFAGCTSLVNAPELPAAILFENSYAYMFERCSNLVYIKCGATDISAYNCLLNWTRHVPSSGTFVKAAGVQYPSGDSGIPNGWTVQEV